MVAAQAGDAVSYEQLLRELYGWLSRYCVRRLPLSMVEDAIRDTLLAIHLKRHTFDPARPFGPWLAAIARYKWVDKLRAIKATPTEELSQCIAVPDHEEAVVALSSLERLMRELKPAQSEVIRLVKLQGHSVAEPAARTGQSISLVEVSIHRGLQRLTAIAREAPKTD